MAHELDQQHLEILPEHLTDEHARRRPGAPKDIASAPTADQRAYERRVAELCERHVENDALVRRLRDGDVAAAQIVHDAVAGLARETAGLAWDRARAVAKGQTDKATAISGRRVRCLSALAKIVARQHDLEACSDSLPPAQLLAASRLWERLIAEAASVLPDDAREALLARFGVAMERWREGAGLTSGE